MIRITLIFAIVFGLAAKAGNETRTIHYLPYALYWVNDTGEMYNSKQTLFLGTIRSTTCRVNDQASYKSWIQGQFSRHVESTYQSSLGVRHELEGRGAYWQWEDGRRILEETYNKMVERYPNKVYVNTFYLNCGSTLNTQLTTGRYWDANGNSGYFKELGEGNYWIELWQGKEASPAPQNWYSNGKATMRQDGIIHSVLYAVEGHEHFEWGFEGYWQITDSETIKLLKYRNFLKASPPTSSEEGWKDGFEYKLAR